MFRLKHALLLLLIAFLAACGSQAELPSAVPSEQTAIGEISTTELEQAFDARGLSAQTYWNKHKFNKFVLEKKVEGYGPEHQKYPVAVVCKVPYKPHLLAVVGAGKLKDGQKTYFYVPKKYVKCAAIELETFGDHVFFKYKQGGYSDYSGVEYEGKVYIWGKKLDFKASEFFHVKDGKKHGEARFTVINKYEYKPEPKKLEIELKKLFKVGYADSVHPTDYHLTVKLICENGTEVSLSLGKHDYSGYAHELQGQKCYIKEQFYDDEYQTKQFNVNYANYKGYYEGSKGESWNDCTSDGYYDNCQSSLAYKPFHIYIDEHTTKLVFVIVDNVHKKEKPKKLEIELKKIFKVGYSEEVHPSGYHLVVKLVCDNGKEVSLSLGKHDYSEYAHDLLGQKCRIKEQFYDDEYKTKQFNVNYENYEDYDKGSYGSSWNDCWSDDSYDYCESNWDGKTYHIYIDEHTTKLVIVIVDNVHKKEHYLTAS